MVSASEARAKVEDLSSRAEAETGRSTKQIKPRAADARLMLQQLALERQAAAIAGEAAVGADHPVTGHDQGDGIGAVGGANGAGRGGMSRCFLATAP